MYKLLYYEILNYQPSNLKILYNNFDVVSLESPLDDRDEILSQIEIILAPLGFKCNKEKIDKMPKLKIIASNTTGEPHIDRKYAESKGISVFSLKNQKEFLKTITPTAEHTWGLLLAVIRKTPWAFNSVLNGQWNRRPYGAKSMLSRMTIGIVGLGRLGRLVASYAKGFKVKKIRYYDPHIEPVENNDLERVDKLETLVKTSDIITIHIPAEKMNYKMFNSRIFSKFKRGSYFINTSRAELVDENAMIEALESGILAGAAVDVFDGEFEINQDELLQKSRILQFAKNHDNLIITPHIGGSTLDAWEETEKHTLKLILNSLNLKFKE